MGGSKSSSSSTDRRIAATDQAVVVTEGSRIATDQAVQLGDQARLQTGGVSVGGAVQGDLVIGDVAPILDLAERAGETIVQISQQQTEGLQSALSAQGRQLQEALNQLREIAAASINQGQSQQQQWLFYAALGAIALGAVSLTKR